MTEIVPVPVKDPARAAFRIYAPHFRGQIYEDDVENEHLKEFLRCHFFRKILRDALKFTTRRMGLRAANQIGKTRIGEIIMKHFIKHAPADMMIWDIVDTKSKDHMRNRFLPMLKTIIGKTIADILANDRWDYATQNIALPGMIFRARPLNETWTQSFPVRYGMISDAALAERSGHIRRAFVRSRQNESQEFWFIESQGGILNNGEPADDWTEFMATTNEMKLHVRCPICGSRQRFIFTQERNEETVIVPPVSIPSLDRDAWIGHHKPILMSKERKYAGFRHKEKLESKDDGTLNEQEILATTVYECLHCGGHWNDTPPIREYLDHEAGLDENWIASRPNAVPGYLGYSLPVWINPKKDITWGKVMLNFKQAMSAWKQGNRLNLQEFYTKWAGEDWDPNLYDSRQIKVSPGSYDPNQVMENESDRNMAIDCQEDKDHKEKTGVSITGWFWFVARVYDKFTNSRQLARGFAKSIEAVIAVQKRWKIPNDRVVIDVRQWPEQVRMLAAKYREERPRKEPHIFYGMQPEIITWKLLLTENNKRPFLGHKDGKSRPWSPELKELANLQGEDGKITRMTLYCTRFNKTPVMLQLDAIRSGAPGMPRFEVLGRDRLLLPDGEKDGEPDKLTLEMETGMRTYENQMDSQRYVESSNKFEELRPDDHYRWCEQALLVRKGMDGAYGLPGIYSGETCE